MKKTLTFLLLFPFLLNAQSFYDEFFQNDIVVQQQFDAVCTNPYGQVVTAGRMVDSAGSTNLILAKFDPAGGILQSTSLRYTISYPLAVSLCADSMGYWLTTQSTFYYSILFRLDQNFNIIWMKHILDGTHQVMVSFCRADNSGGCYIGGIYYQPQVYNQEHLAWVTRVDANGNAQWSNQYIWQDHRLGIVSDDAVVSADGNITVPFYVYHGDTTNATIQYYSHGLLKLDSSGSVLWVHAFADSTYHYPYSMVQLSDSSYVIAGISDTGHSTAIYTDFLMRITKTGVPMWEESFNQFTWVGNPEFYDLTEMDNGNVMMTAANSTGTNTLQLQCDTSGQIVSASRTGIVAGSRIIRSTRIPGVGLYFAGADFSQSTRAVLAGTDPAGAMSCEQFPVIINIADTDSFRIDIPVLTLLAGPTLDSISCNPAPFYLDKSSCPADGVEEHSYSPAISLFPNPAESDVQVEWPSYTSQCWHVVVYDAEGRAVSSSAPVTASSGSFSVAGLCSGVYLVNVISDDVVVASEELIVNGSNR